MRGTIKARQQKKKNVYIYIKRLVKKTVYGTPKKKEGKYSQRKRLKFNLFNFKLIILCLLI